MSDEPIPDDIAKTVRDMWQQPNVDEYDVMRALLQERERCAKLCDDKAGTMQTVANSLDRMGRGEEMSHRAHYVAGEMESMAARIRRGDE